MSTPKNTYRTSNSRDLTERESRILALVVRSFIETAGPVGSNFLANNFQVGLSSASIRNTLSELEDLGYLGHPYTSAGRVPTDLGYRLFVDQLMQPTILSEDDRTFLKEQIFQMHREPSLLVRECSRLLGQLSNLLGVVLSPKISSGVLERLEIVPLSSSRIMFVISLQGKLVKTVVLELYSDLTREDLTHVAGILNERLAGLTLEEIRSTYALRMNDVKDEDTGIVRLVLDSSRVFFSEPADDRVSIAGTQNIMDQPEFLGDPEELKKLVEMLEDANFIVHLMEDEDNGIPGRASVRIGTENNDGKVEKYSIVTAQYQFDGMSGIVGVLGPTRMNYARVFALVEGISGLLSRPSDVQN